MMLFKLQMCFKCLIYVTIHIFCIFSGFNTFWDIFKIIIAFFFLLNLVVLRIINSLYLNIRTNTIFTNCTYYYLMYRFFEKKLFGTFLQDHFLEYFLGNFSDFLAFKLIFLIFFRNLNPNPIFKFNKCFVILFLSNYNPHTFWKPMFARKDYFFVISTAL